MDNNYILIAFIISIIYSIIKFIEMRFIKKENKPLKQIVIDIIIVFLSSILTLILMDQFNINEMITNIKKAPLVFTDKPDF
tara:strand:- start:830 stop:1072 length:243 start_codon:yes stop_codon:yes gene_type:complete